jgi:CubicO group peptidase (beta-lactamase class C family)
LASITLALAAIFLAAACAPAQRHSLRDYARERVKPDTAFAYASPREVGMDSKKLETLLSEIDEKKLEIHSISILRDGKLVMDAYGTPRASKAPLTPSDWHELNSLAHGVVSLLVCIAQEEGTFPAGNSPVMPWFAKDGVKNRNADKDAITIDDLLTMRSGIDWNDDVDSDLLIKSPNGAKAVLDKPMFAKPGKEWRTNNGEAQIVSEIFKRSTGKTLKRFAAERLFEPLGIVSFDWKADRSQTTFGSWGLSMAPRDFLKIGYLCLKGGSWKGKQIVPEERFANSIIDRSVTTYPDERVALLWWKPSFGGFAAYGWLGQTMYILPEQDLIVLITANMDGESAGYVEHRLMTDYILPAIK